MIPSTSLTVAESASNRPNFGCAPVWPCALAGDREVAAPATMAAMDRVLRCASGGIAALTTVCLLIRVPGLCISDVLARTAVGLVGPATTLLIRRCGCDEGRKALSPAHPLHSPGTAVSSEHPLPFPGPSSSNDTGDRPCREPGTLVLRRNVADREQRGDTS